LRFDFPLAVEDPAGQALGEDGSGDTRDSRTLLDMMCYEFCKIAG
jgi:hypothetical protein